MVEESVRDKIGNFKNKLLSNKKLDIIHFPYATKPSRQWKTKERFTSKESNTFHYRIRLPPQTISLTALTWCILMWKNLSSFARR